MVGLANSKCLQDRRAAINRRQISQKWPQLHHLHPRKHHLVVLVDHLLEPDPQAQEDRRETIRLNMAQWGLRHT